MKFRRLVALVLFLASTSCLFAQDVAETSENPLNKKLSVEGLLPVLADDIEEGSYEIDIATSSSMFKVEKTVLTVKYGTMTAELTLSGKGYSNVAMLTAQEAESLTSLEGTTATTDENGKLVFTVPVKSLNTELSCSAFSKKKQKWYERRVVFYSQKIPSENLFVTPYAWQKCNLKDGQYSVTVKLSGGTGRASIKSPASLSVKNGLATARIEWSSPNYDYMIVNKEKILPLQSEGNSTFELPVILFDKPMSVSADTTAMGTPHEIFYQIEFSLSSAHRNLSRFYVIIFVAILLVIILLTVIFLRRLCFKKKN